MTERKHITRINNIIPFLNQIDNGYTPTEDELSDLAQITELNGWVGRETDSVPQSIRLLTNLESLDLSFCGFTNIDALASVPSLEYLNLSHTHIFNLNILSSLSNLRELDLSNTPVWNIDALSPLTNLQSLDLSDTAIPHLTPLSALPNLRELDLSNTPVTNIDALSTLQHLQTLALNDMTLDSLAVLAALPELTHLRLRQTKVSDFDVLASLSGLQFLELDNTAFSNIALLCGLRNLKSLSLQGTQISDIGTLSSLTELATLSLSHTRITDIAPLAGLPNLEWLYLGRTDISNIDVLAGLTKLRLLQLGNTRITSLEPLTNLKALEILHLWQTFITSLEPLSGLTNLQILSLWGTPLTNIDALSGLHALERLDISYTEITTLPAWLGNLNHLSKLDLSGLQLSAIPRELLRLELPFGMEDPGYYDSAIVLQNTVLATQPISLFEQPRELIEAYYNALQIPVNEAKVIFLGDGGAGKTHTIQRIQNDGKKGKYETETTPGIEITSYPVEIDNRTFNIHFWDFGGQEIMHAMHRCFLTDRTCYVIVVSNRWDLNNRARYWLKNIDSFAEGAPVILAINRWDNIQETGIDMSRLTKDYPNLVNQPIYYSAKDSTDEEFHLLTDAIIREAGKLDSTAMSFPIQWAAIRQQLLDMAEEKHYIDKDEYHHICEEQKLDSLQIRSWLLEWFNDLGVCFSYHQDETGKTELESYKVLNPRWLTNAIYIIINAGKRYADKGRMHLNLIQDLLEHPESGVLPNVTYTENERDYVLDVMRKFNLSYSVSEDLEFIPALCDSETPRNLHPTGYQKQLSYQMQYAYLPDSVVHQLMIRSYKNLNPEKIWRKGLRIDLEWFELAAVVDMGNDDSTLRIDVYANGMVEPWELLHKIRKDITSINSALGLSAEDFIIIHTDTGDIPVTVNSLLDAKEQMMDPLPIYNKASRTWERYPVDELLGMAFGEKVMAAAVKQAQEEKQPLTEVFPKIKIDAVHVFPQSIQPDVLQLIEYLIQNNCETNARLLECLVTALLSIDTPEAKDLAQQVRQDHQEKKNFLKRLEEYMKPAASILTSGKSLYAGAKTVAAAVQKAAPQILEAVPELEGFLNSISPL